MSQALGGAGNALIKPEAVGDYILDNMGIDASLRTTPEERQAIMQQVMAMQQQAAMQQQGQQGAAPGPSVQEAPPEGEVAGGEPSG